MDDDDELAELRAQRAARAGQGASLVSAIIECSSCKMPPHLSHDIKRWLLQSQLREQQRKAEAGRQDTAYYERYSYCCTAVTWLYQPGCWIDNV